MSKRKPSRVCLLVQQEDPNGCVVACCAMVRGVPYAEVAREFGPVGRGFSHFHWQEYLARYGFASQLFFRHDSLAKADRKPWPPKLWADLHLCTVNAGRGEGSHLVVVLRDGTVLDPARETHAMLSDYGKPPSYMAAVYQVGSAPECLT